jgi:uridine kinase
VEVDVETIVDGMLGGIPVGRRALVAIDGIGASGKTAFADLLAARVSSRPVLVLHADDFFNPSDVRHGRGRNSPQGFWLDAYNYPALISTALEPLGRGTATYREASYDRRTGESFSPEPRTAPPDAIVLVEGTFLHRDELVAQWDFSVYLDIPFEVAARRMIQRDVLPPDIVRGLMQRYLGAQRLYFANARPWQRASVVMDNSDPLAPVIIPASEASAARESAEQ